MSTLNGLGDVAEDRRASDRLESPELARGGQVEDEQADEDDEDGPEDGEKERRRGSDHHEHHDDLPEHHDEAAERDRHHKVDQVEVLREAVQDAARRRRVEKRHRRVQQTVWRTNQTIQTMNLPRIIIY